MSKLRLLLIALFAIVSSTVFGVNIRISDTGDVGNTFQIDCDASASEQTTTTFFYDSGLTGNYSANESYIRDLASTNGGALSIKFVEFNLATGTVMTIKDAISQAVLVSNATGTQLNGRTFTSNRGALQIIWSSSTSVGSGFKAKVWCGSRCQAFQTTINVAGITPTVDNGVQYFDICSGTGVNFSAQNTFNVPVGDPQHEYDQTDANLTYHWYYIDGGNDTTRLTGSSQNISINFAEGGGYYVVCDAEDTQGCLNRNVNKRQVRVSMRPDFRGTTFTPDTICPGSPVTFSGRVNAHPWSMEIPEIVAGATFLPDGNSTCYSTSLVFDIFADGATITSRDQIERLYLNLEHSYFGDLSILLECPSGQRCLIHAHGTGTMASLNWSLSNAGYQVQGSAGGGGFNLGHAPDPGSGDPCYYTAGEGWDYNIYPGGTTPWGNNSPTVQQTFRDPCGNNITASCVMSNSVNQPASQTNNPSLQYGPYENMASLVGCPLNGTWTIYVCDHLSSDNGWIFEWGLFFRDDMYPTDLWSFTNTYPTTNYSWQGGSITSGATGAASATANPQNPDINNAALIPYTFAVVDNFNCSYDTTVTVYTLSSRDPSCCVQPTPTITAGSTNPCGNTTTLTINGGFSAPGNTGHWEYTGPGVATFGEPTSPTTSVSINVYGDYTFTWHEYYQGNESCAGEASVNINFAQVLSAVLDPITSRCRSGQTIQINAINYGTLTCSPNTAAFNAAAYTFTPGLAAPGTYTITNTITGERCASPNSHAQAFTIYDELSVTNREETCNSGQSPTITVSFDVNGVGSPNPPTYSITGSYTQNASESPVTGSLNETNLSGTSYTFTKPSALDYALTVSDNNGCSSIAVAGFMECDCPNYAGTFASYSPQIMCTGDNFNINHNGDQTTHETGVFSYVVCTDPLNLTASVRATLQGNANVVRPNDIAQFSFGTQYYLVAIAGYGLGTAAFNAAGCRSVSQPVPLMWKQTPTPTNTGASACGLVMQLNGSPIPDGMTGYWTATGPDGVTNYTYTTVENTTNIMNNATVLASHYGQATYTWNVCNAECTGQAAAIYNFRQVPTPEAGPNKTVCGVSAEITEAHATYPIIEGSTLQWSGNGVTMTGGATIQPVANANTSGTYTLTLTERNGECSGSDNVVITYLAVPSPATTANVDTVCGHIAELEVYNANESLGHWTAYDMNHNPLGTVVYHRYGDMSAPSSSSYTHCFVTVPIPDDANQVEYEFIWTEPIDDPRLPAGESCVGEAIKHIVFRKVPVVSVHQCGSTGNSQVVCGNSVELCADASASEGYAEFSWICKDVLGRFTDSLSTNTQFTLDTNISITRYMDVPIYFVARNASCMAIDTMNIRFLQRPVANAGLNHVVCGRDYTLNGAWSLLPDATYTPVCQWTTVSKPDGALNPTWANNPHDSIMEPVHVNDYGIYQFQVRETNTAGGASDCYSVDTVTVEFMEQPVVNAGDDFDVCGLDFTMRAIGSQIEGNNITGSWICLSGGQATFDDRTNPHANGHYSAYGPATFQWVETNHPHITPEDNEPTCAAFDEVVVTFYEIPSAAINMNPADTITCGLTFEYLRADDSGSGITGYWYEESPSTQFGPQNSTVGSTVTDVTVPSYGRHGFYWIEYTGPQNNPRFCKDTAGPWYVNFMEMPNAEIPLDTVKFCVNAANYFSLTPSDLGYYNTVNSNFNGVGVGRWSTTAPSSVLSFEDRGSSSANIHTTILNSDNPSYPYYTLYWQVQNTEFCTDQDSIRVIFARIPSDSVTVIPPKCFGEPAVLLAADTTLTSYEWNFGTGINDSTISNRFGAEYGAFVYWTDKEENHTVDITTTNSWGCRSNVGRISVAEPQLPEYNYNIIMDTCSLGRGGIEFLDTTGLFSFFWIDTTVGPTITNPATGYPLTSYHVYNIPAGTYTYRSDYQSFNREFFSSYYNYFNDVYCHDFPQVEIGTIGMIEAEFAVSADVVLSDLVAPNANVIFVNSTNYDNVGKRCEWHFGDGSTERNCDELVQHVYTEPGCYEPYLVVMNRDIPQCRDTAYIDECVFIDKESKLEVPNIFSPNGDGMNDFFQVEAQTLKTFQGTIINRYGRKVFEWTDWENEDAGWDGRLNGSTKAVPGVYFYVIEAEGFDGQVYKLEGSLHLVR